jgi:two-component system chemotaxis sensor kinase CheA
MAVDQKDRFQLYIDDAKEQLDSVEQNLLLLEQSGENDLDIVNKIFRGVHTVKGGADFLGLDAIKRIAHAAEDVLDLVRNQELELTRDGMGLLLVATDTLKEMVANPSKSDGIDIANLLNEINKLSEKTAAEDHRLKIDTNQLELGLSFAPSLFSLSRKDLAKYHQEGFNLYVIEFECPRDASSESSKQETFLSTLNEIGYVLDQKGPLSVSLSGETDEVLRTFVLFRTVLSKTLTIRYLGLDLGHIYSLRNVGTTTNAHALDVVIEPPGQAGHEGDDSFSAQLDELEPGRREKRRSRVIDHHGPVSVNTPGMDASTTTGRSKIQTVTPAGISSATGSANTGALSREDGRNQVGGNIRVNVEILDNLMNLAGELVLTRNQLNQNVEIRDHNAITLAAQRLDTITTELQESIMSTRMQPISIVLDKFHRVIRDMSHQLHKSINLVLEGEDVELDKSIIENIGDPLTHLVRNAIDHGIETPDLRRAANKPETGTLSIKAQHEAGHVVIEVSDDGKGINANEIREAALRKGIIDRNRAEEISEKELLKLIFIPGFSTVEEVSDISGRGVGMDVVFTNLSRLGGTIDIDTNIGKGTSFKIKLPLTLAIVPSLLVSVAEDVFAIPQVNLIELVRLPPGQTEKIEYIGDSAVLRLRGKLLPIVWLREYLGMNNKAEGETALHTLAQTSNTDKEETDSTNVVVVAAGDFHYGIVVDHLTDSEEIVVKPLGAHLRNCKGYAGATILGDGRAALILDVVSIAESVSLVDHEDREGKADELLVLARESIGNEERLLIVENAADEYFGIQLAYVNRIERILESKIEQVGKRNVVKYRGGVLRVFGLEEALASKPRTQRSHAYLVIFQMLGIEVAIIISNIIDIVESDAKIDNETFRQPGVVGSSIILDHITLLLDLFELVKSIDPDMGAARTANRGNEDSVGARTVLVVEDSMFFRDKLESMLKELKINVLLAGDGQVGWETLNTHDKLIDLVLMDVEMPKMSGLELTRRLRADPRFRDLPVLMLTSLAKESDVEKGKKAGASEYLIKMDEEMVKQTIFKYFSLTPKQKKLAA